VIRVLLLGRPATGGLRAHIVELICRMDRAKFEPWVVGPPTFINDLPANLPNFVAAPCPVESKVSPADIPAARRLLAIIADAERQPQPDAATPETLAPNRRTVALHVIVHAHGIRAAWVAALAHLARPFPLVVTLHNIPPAGFLGNAAIRFLTARADRIVCVSQAIADRVNPRAAVIPNGVEPGRFVQLDREGARKEFGLSDTDFIVGCIARLSHEKGVDVLVEAAKRLPSATFLIEGDGPERAAITAVAGANVRLLGRVESVLPLLAACDVIAVPSRSEGQGIVALEALAAGRAVVASNVGGLPGMIADGINGLLVPSESPEMLSYAISRLQADKALRDRLGAAGQEYAREHGDIREMVSGVESVYEAVAGK
jgi:glycosyltransferase involved in cell wall biosynthesis